jgi:hypothetical protein
MHRKELVQRPWLLYFERKNVLLVGPEGIGKTTILREASEGLSLRVCYESSSLGQICDWLENELGWHDRRLNIIERKNRLLRHLEEQRETVAFDQVAETPPRVARFIAHLVRQVPVWIVCRSDQRGAIGHIWEYLYNFTRIEVPSLTLAETSALIGNAVASGKIQSDAAGHSAELQRISKGVPRVIEGLLAELAARNYKMEGQSGLHLLELDRQIREFGTVSSKLQR